MIFLIDGEGVISYSNHDGREDRLVQPCEPESVSGHVSRRVRVAAYAVPLCVLPSALWRLHAIFVKDFAPACRGLMGAWEPFYVTSLSVISLGAALLTVGLVRPWGEVAPGWVPFLGGRVVPVRAAVILAGAGAALIFGIYAYALLNLIFHMRETPDIPGCPTPLEETNAWVAVACYAPLLAWGPLLVAVTVAYYRRRTRGKMTRIPATSRVLYARYDDAG